MFYRYLLLMKAFHVDQLPRRQQFSSMPDSVAAARMVPPTRIMLALILLCDNYPNINLCWIKFTIPPIMSSEQP